MKIPDGWVKEEGRLVLMIKGADFMRTLALLNAVGDIAQSHNHHPDLAIRNYNELIVSTTTHDAGSLTEKDYKLAQEITDLISSQEKNQHKERHGRR